MITVYPIHYRQIIATGTEKRVILCFYLPMQFPPQDVSELLDATLWNIPNIKSSYLYISSYRINYHIFFSVNTVFAASDLIYIAIPFCITILGDRFPLYYWSVMLCVYIYNYVIRHAQQLSVGYQQVWWLLHSSQNIELLCSYQISPLIIYIVML